MASFLKALFRKNTPSPAPKGPDRQSLQRAACARLQRIDLENPQNRLPVEKIRELNITGVINYALSQLHYSSVIDQNVLTVHNHLLYLVDALEDAVQNGYEMTAEWACAALVCAVKNLGLDIPGLSQDYVQDLTACQAKYSENLRLLVEVCRELDHATNVLAELTLRRQQKHDRLEHSKSSYQSRRDSGALDALLAELAMYAHVPFKLSDEALELRDELANMHLLKASILEIDTTIEADQNRLKLLQCRIEARLLTLSVLANPQLRDRISEFSNIYQEHLRRALSDAEQGLEDFGVRIDIMQKMVANSIGTNSHTTSLLQEVNTLIESLSKVVHADTDEHAAARKTHDFHSHPERMAAPELTNIDDL